ncbi:MAG: hypothetical protein U5L02_11400 [Rheinheimera sp.]|nr:hypothetical protein [Rheinheimera sp.]
MGDTTAPAVWLQYSEDRKGLHPTAHLKGYQGSLQADGATRVTTNYTNKKSNNMGVGARAGKFYDITQSGPSFSPMKR